MLRTDITALGWLRTLWPRIVSQSLDSSRRVVLMNLDDGWDVVVLDENSPSLLRGLGAISDPAELGRELTLSLLQAGANIETGEIVVFTKREVSEDVVERIKAFAPVRIERVEEKFAKLERFYRDGLSVVGWERYRVLDVRFSNQVVCR